MANYHITLIAPQGNIHIACFRETIMLLKSSLEQLGHNCTFKTNQFDINSLNIIIGAHLLNPMAIPDNCKFIVYQFEQLSDTEGCFNNNLQKVLERAETVWDYSLDNLNFLAEKKINAQYLPFGFSTSLHLINNKIEKDIDMLFYGSLNDRRKNMITVIESITGKKVTAVFGIYGEDRDKLIARSKIVLNLHFYEAQIFEVVRVSYLINNQVATISENSLQYPYPKVPLIMRSNAEEIAKEITKLLNNENLRLEYGFSCLKAFETNYSMSKILNSVLEDLS